jgi:hypothetical protein
VSTIAEIAANLMKLELLRADTFLSTTAGQQAMVGEELIAFFKVTDGPNFHSGMILDNNAVPQITNGAVSLDQWQIA